MKNGPKNGGKLNNLPHLKQYRKELRNKLTPAEAALWTCLRNGSLEGRKFRRQHSVANYILDFYCPSEKLAIELDGKRHFGGITRYRDRERGLFLKKRGIKVLRFENRYVFEELNWVIDVIKGNFGWQENKDTRLQPPPG